MRLVRQAAARNPDDRPRDAGAVALSLERSLRRRMPDLVGPAGDAELAKYVAHIRQVAPIEEAPPSVPVEPPLDKAGKQKAYEEAWGSAPKLPSADARRAEEATATVAPPVEGAWLSATGSPAPVDGSVVGTWAVAGAQRPGTDNSGGYALLDPADLVEASRSGLLPVGATDAGPVGEDAETSVWQAPAEAPPSEPRARPEAPVAPSQAPVAKVGTEGRRAYPPSIERILASYPKLERLVHAQPPPQLVVAILATALVTGVLVAYVIASIV